MATIPTKKVILIESNTEVIINISDFDSELHMEMGVIPESKPESFLSDLNAKEAKNFVRAVGSATVLDALEAEESNGKSRIAVLNVIDKRREELSCLDQ